MRSVCKIQKCSRYSVAKGYCQTHYQRLMRTGSAESVDIREENLGWKCRFLGCNEEAHTRGLCPKHYKYLWRKAREEGTDFEEYLGTVKLRKTRQRFTPPAERPVPKNKRKSKASLK